MSLVHVQRTSHSLPGGAGGPGSIDGPVTPSRVRTLSECYFAVRGAAVILAPQADPPTCSRGGGEIEVHLQAMMNLLRAHDKMFMTVRLQTTVPGHARYLSVIQAPDSVLLLGVDCLNGNTTLGVVVPLSFWTRVELDGDDGVAVSLPTATHIFRPISVQAMWKVFQRLRNELERQQPIVPNGAALSFYRQRVNSPDDLCWQWRRLPLLPDWMSGLREGIADTGGDVALRLEIKTQLRQIMQTVDLDTVTSRDIREQLHAVMQGRVESEREFVDREMLVILGQMDHPTKIFDYLLLGTEWNASNYHELTNNGVRYILNVTREVDNFFPLHFHYLKVRVSDEDSTQLLTHWNQIYCFIKSVKEKNAVVLVHCKKGISRSSSTVIAYVMKECGKTLDQAVEFVRDRRKCITPNAGFVKQLETWNGLLQAEKNGQSTSFSSSEMDLRTSQTNQRSRQPTVRAWLPFAAALNVEVHLNEKEGDFGFLHLSTDDSFAHATKLRFAVRYFRRGSYVLFQDSNNSDNLLCANFKSPCALLCHLLHHLTPHYTFLTCRVNRVPPIFRPVDAVERFLGHVRIQIVR